MQFFTNLIKQHVRTSENAMFLIRQVVGLLSLEHIEELGRLIQPVYEKARADLPKFEAIVNEVVAGSPAAAGVTEVETVVNGIVETVDTVATVVDSTVAQTESVASETVPTVSEAATPSPAAADADATPSPAAAPAKTWKPNKA